MLRYFIVDDDQASRSMLKNIITEGELGVVIGQSESGVQSVSAILGAHPDIVLIDLLMPELDGIETIEHLMMRGFRGKFIMISQVVNKEMVGEAYEKGVEFFIHKPINRIEVQSILKKTTEQFKLRESLLTIRESLAHIGSNEKPEKRNEVRDIALTILNDMGIVGEAGSEDIIAMMEILVERNEGGAQLPPLKELYETVAHQMESQDVSVKREVKAIEQRIRRTILSAVTNVASLGAIDYTIPEFEYYAPRYFDFKEIRSCMKQIQEGSEKPMRVKVNTKKFLQVLYLDTLEKFQAQ